MIKRFVLDTNILLGFPRSMVEDFEDNTIIICGTVLQELNSKKQADGEVGYNAREAGRILDDYRQRGDLMKGVPTESGGTLIFEPDGVRQEYLPDGFSIDVPDNRILSTCIHLNKQNPESPVILVTSDVLMRLSATACGIKCQEFRKILVQDTDYTGYRTEEVDWKLIDKIYDEKVIDSPIIDNIFENEFVTLTSGTLSALTVFQNGALNLIPKQRLFGWVSPKNALQTYAMWALSQPAEKIPLVILEGEAGTAKTFLSMAAGLDKTYTSQNRRESEYYKMMLTRPIANAFDGGQGMGYLPGSLEEKLHYLYQSYYDNLRILLRGTESKESEAEIQQQIEDMIADGVIEVGGLAFIRGRSLSQTYLVCDECQNASKTLVRDITTRAGMGTKVVLAGDPSQIDAPTLSRRNNGLVNAAEAMKESSMCAYIKFTAETSVRSPLAKEAIKRMNW